MDEVTLLWFWLIPGRVAVLVRVATELVGLYSQPHMPTHSFIPSTGR